ncbi:MAG: NlpC/P60 family protein [Bdellovibrionales bacterium]|nr:NlpC/P60 family protein [Bdellovibrionales bacterium]
MRFDSWPCHFISALVVTLLFGAQDRALANPCQFAFQDLAVHRPGKTKRVVIEITLQELPAIMTGDGAGFRARQVNVHAGSMSFGLHNIPGPMDHISPTAKAYIFRTEEGGKRFSIELPNAMKARLVEYIRNGGPPKKGLEGSNEIRSECRFDCNSFVHYVTGVSYEYGKFSTDQWTLSRIDYQNPIQLGDVILIGYGDREINHVAINIGDDLYISKFGASGPVLVTDLTTLQMAYGGLGLLSAKPKGPAGHDGR